MLHPTNNKTLPTKEVTENQTKMKMNAGNLIPRTTKLVWNGAILNAHTKTETSGMILGSWLNFSVDRTMSARKLKMPLKITQQAVKNV